jgi:ssDNA-binding replication factor A large subunit
MGAELEGGTRQVVVEGTATKRFPLRTVPSSKTGEKPLLTEVELSGDSGSASLVLWNEQESRIHSDRIRIEKGYAKSYRGKLQLSVSKCGHIVSLT